MSDLTYEIPYHMMDIKSKIILLLVIGYYDSISLMEFTDTSEFNDCIIQANEIIKENKINRLY